MSKNVESSDVEIEKKKKKKHDQFGEDSQNLTKAELFMFLCCTNKFIRSKWYIGGILMAEDK